MGLGAGGDRTRCTRKSVLEYVAKNEQLKKEATSHSDPQLVSPHWRYVGCQESE